MTESFALTSERIAQWADDPKGPVALVLKQKLKSVEGDNGVVFPPTYADIGYSIDTLSDGTQIATIDSIGSQANRMEPLFKKDFCAKLVPQIDIRIPRTDKETKTTEYVIYSILDLPHRAGDAVVLSCPTLRPAFADAFKKKEQGNAVPLAKLAPTSFIFGVWDSRASQQKVPRILKSVIRAEDIDILHTAAQYNSVWKSLGEAEKDTLQKDKNSKKLADRGFKDVPSVFRKLSQDSKITKYVDGHANPEARVLGGVIARGAITRTTTLNLVALRNLGGATDDEGLKLRRYILGLALLAATEEMELFLREGCLLKYAEDEDQWEIVPRRGDSDIHLLSSDKSKQAITDFAAKAAEEFGIGEIKRGPYDFDLKEASKLLSSKEASDESEDG